MTAETPIEKLPKVIPALAKRLHHLGIKTVRDLLFHFPARYDDFTNVKSIGDLTIGEIATISGRIKKISSTRAWRRRMSITEAIVEDDLDSIRVIWFNQPYLVKTLPVGSRVSLAGKLTTSKRGEYFANPAYEKIGMSDGLRHTGGWVPIYPETTGLTSRWIRFLMREVAPVIKKIPDPLPSALLKKSTLLPLERALSKIHFPESKDEYEEARKRFAFEDILLIQLRVLMSKKQLEEKKAPPIPLGLEEIKKFIASLPFSLTDGQRRAAWDIMRDTAKSVPMNRLLEGDVGSGKTVVAALTSFNAIRSGYQVAYLAPTEILAIQHFNTLRHWLSPFGVYVGLLTAAHKKFISDYGERDRVSIRSMTEAGEIPMLIGTQAVIQDGVKFKNLGLVIVDEQHRFGVAQRAKLLRQKQTGNSQEDYSPSLIPHFLSMTATPIPRTLALTIYGDLDVSILNQVPQGRKPIVTKIVPEEKRSACYQFIRDEVHRGRQVFVICPRIELNEEMGNGKWEMGNVLREEVKAVKTEYEKLSKQIFPDLKVAMLHGKMKSKEKENVMRDFKEGKSDVLISTSVIEVGVDVPNATIMLIDGAEKFGLAQIHQFRGRVGRASHQSYCFLMTGSRAAAESQRLKALVTAKNGFELAEKDLAIRGPGDFLGTRQSGIPPFAYKSFNDLELVQSSRDAAREIIEKDPKLERHVALQKNLVKFEETVHFE
ncbi:MAG: ATP-dependent DNA helicase RecG [Candidatus Sungbacteria bacterium]|uniref:ATP-dependent DNA helicase RecG n=1 Tax=Candidatus Sungiibacteriota bacterium TaxID=2750080 RepID=A0A9D6LRM5_9BACT|nr:ATP-dependent DNA helicase RecG [Candidatus Sungbacteria bacterium]